MKTPEEFLKDGGFTLAQDIDRAELISSFVLEMERGLAGESSSLAMIPTYVGVTSRVPQHVRVAVLDAGGTNFRSAVVSFPPNIENRFNQPMPGTKGEVDVETFYEILAREVSRVSGDTTSSRVGFCFSYPAEVTPELDARLCFWTKGVCVPGVVGQYVGSELSKRVGGRHIAVVNDTVATLLAAKATEGERIYSSYIGFILGTGTNAAYVERNVNILKLPGLDPNGSMIINAESGGFDKIELSQFDRTMDARYPATVRNRFERMISGAYLGPIGLEILLSAAKAGYFTAAARTRLAGLAQLETRDLSEFCASYSDGRANALFSIFSDESDARLARRFTLPVFERAAVLTAVHLSAFAIKSGEGIDEAHPIAIQVDGSTYYKTKAIPFADMVRRELNNLLVVRRNIHFELTPPVEDAPLIGAAIAALIKD